MVSLPAVMRQGPPGSSSSRAVLDLGVVFFVFYFTLPFPYLALILIYYSCRLLVSSVYSHFLVPLSPLSSLPSKDFDLAWETIDQRKPNTELPQNYVSHLTAQKVEFIRIIRQCNTHSSVVP